MNRRAQVAALAGALLGLAACGPERPSFSLRLEGLGSGPSQFQLAVLGSGPPRCPPFLLQQTECLDVQIALSDLVPMFDAQGNPHSTLVVASPGGPAQTQVSVTVPVGDHYTIVIEQMSTDASPKLLANSCDDLQQAVQSGGDTLVSMPSLQAVTPTPACNPKI